MPHVRVEDLAWMAGNWSCEIWGGTFEENWSRPAGGTMQATGRHIADGKTGMMEFLSIEAQNGAVSMYISIGELSKGPRTPEKFDLVTLDGRTAVFEREKENDFPKTITYTLKSANEMDCVLVGIEDGRENRADFHFARRK